MKKYCYLMLIIISFVLPGCGSTVTESLKVNPALKTDIGKQKMVVILPFADYTEADSLESAYRRNMFVNENLTDRFVSNSFNLPVQEDIFRYLVNRNIINVLENKYGNR